MATWSWKGPSGNQSSDWFVTSNWTTNSGAAFPQPGDTVTIGSTFTSPTISASDPGGGTLDDLVVGLGENTLTTDGTDFGTTFALTTGTADTSSSLLLSAGPVQYAGTLIADGTTTIGLAGSLPACTFTLTGTIVIAERQRVESSLGQSGTFVNNGSILVAQRGDLDIESGALGGTGTVNLATASSAFFVGGVAAGQTIELAGTNTDVTIANVSQFLGTIAGYQAGDVLAFNGIIANGVSYDAATSTLTLTENGTEQAAVTVGMAAAPPTLHVQQGRSGALVTTSDASLIWNGGTGDWFDPTNWTVSSGGTAVPQPGDSVTLDGGTATISAVDAATSLLEAETINLGSTNSATPAVLQVTDATFGRDTAIRGGADQSSGTFEAIGSTGFNGRVSSTARAGSLTLDIESNGTTAVFENEKPASLIATQKGTLRITGNGTIENTGLILAQGSIDIGSGVDVVDNAGTILVQNGGSLTVEGSIDSTISFADATGRITLVDLAKAQQSLISGFQEGNAIDLANVQADSFNYDTASALLTLIQQGTTVGSLHVSTFDKQSTFALATDGGNGTLISYDQPNPLLVDGFPIVIAAAPGQTVPLATILTEAFGTVPASYASYGLSYMGASALANADWSYWNPAQPSVSPWLVNGTIVAPQSESPPLTATQTLTAAQISTAAYQAGNNIGPEQYIQVPISGNGSVPTQNIYYALITVDPHVISPTASSGIVNPSDIVASALRFAAFYPNPPNDNDCNFIAAAMAGAAGATMPFRTGSTDPNANESGGFWRIIYRGIDQQNPVSDWSTLVQPGDIVRMGWQGGGEHTTTILAKNADGSVVVYDNIDDGPDAGFSTIGIHDANYWNNTLPTSITIYRLDPGHQYLITDGPQADIIQGSIYDNLIQPGGGADSITAGAASNEIQDIATDLNGVTVTDFHAGDQLDVTDLAPGAASVTYDSNSGTLSIFDDLTLVSNLNLPVGLTGHFTTATDGNGGTLVNLGTLENVECFATGTRLLTPHGERAVETLKTGDGVVTLAGVVKPIEWIGHRHIDCRRHPDPRLVSPVCIRAAAFGPGLPHRDVWLSPDHAVFFEDVLIPIKYLINGTTIAQMPTREVVYYHIELERHDVLLAEGLPAESYLDTGNRMRFTNAGRIITLHPDFATLAWQASGYAPLVVTGPELDRVRRRLALREKRVKRRRAQSDAA